MPLDSAKNFAKVSVSTGYGADATALVLVTGQGAKLPTVPFNAVWWNSSTYPDPADDPHVEVVRVTDRSGDTLTIVRAQEGSSASAKNTAGKTYKLIAGPTAKLIADMQALIDELGEGAPTNPFDQLLNTDDAPTFADLTVGTGATGTFVSQDGKVITVTAGLITDISEET